jgi:hypothetical protein
MISLILGPPARLITAPARFGIPGTPRRCNRNHFLMAVTRRHGQPERHVDGSTMLGGGMNDLRSRHTDPFVSLRHHDSFVFIPSCYSDLNPSVGRDLLRVKGFAWMPETALDGKGRPLAIAAQILQIRVLRIKRQCMI